MELQKLYYVGRYLHNANIRFVPEESNNDKDTKDEPIHQLIDSVCECTTGKECDAVTPDSSESEIEDTFAAPKYLTNWGFKELRRKYDRAT
jgi:hypothetical protein